MPLQKNKKSRSSSGGLELVCWRKLRGFSLVEVSLALAIVALILGSALQMFTAMAVSSETKDTRERLALMRDRIIGFVTANQRLPAYATGNGSDEITALFPDGRDRWGRKLVYIYDTQLARTDVTALACAKKTTNLIVRYCDSLLCLSPRSQTNVAFLVFSSGRDQVNQTGASGSPHTESLTSDASVSGPDGTPGTPRTITIYPAGTQLGIYSAPATNPTENDDVMHVVSLEDLRTKLNCQGTPLRLVNNDLPTGAASTAYSAIIYADGGVPVAGATGSYRWCVETTVSPSSTVSNIVNLEAVRPDATTATVALSASGACATAAQNTWVVGQTFRVRGATAGALNTTTAGTYDITVYVRDDQNPDAGVAGTADLNDNIVFRKYVLGINGT